MVVMSGQAAKNTGKKQNKVPSNSIQVQFQKKNKETAMKTYLLQFFSPAKRYTFSAVSIFKTCSFLNYFVEKLSDKCSKFSSKNGVKSAAIGELFAEPDLDSSVQS